MRWCLVGALMGRTNVQNQKPAPLSAPLWSGHRWPQTTEVGTRGPTTAQCAGTGGRQHTNNNSKKVELAGSTHTRKLATQKLLLSAFSVSSNRTVFRADPNIALGSPHKWLSRHIAAASITTSTLRSNLFVVVLFFLFPDSAKHDFQRRVAERAVVVSLNFPL